MYSLHDKVIIVNELCPLLLCKYLRCLQANVYVSVLQTLQKLLTYSEGTVNYLGKDDWSRFPLFPFIWGRYNIFSLFI